MKPNETHPSGWNVARWRSEIVAAALNDDSARLRYLQANPPAYTAPVSENETACPF